MNNVSCLVGALTRRRRSSPAGTPPPTSPPPINPRLPPRIGRRMGRSPRPRPRPGAAAGALALLSLLLLSAAAGAGALQELDWFHEGLFGAEEALRAVQARHHWTRMLDLKLEEIINQLGFEPAGNGRAHGTAQTPSRLAHPPHRAARKHRSRPEHETPASSLSRTTRRRFEAIGPLGPRCLQPEILGSGPTGTRACGLSRISRELGDACVVVNVAALADPTDFVFEAAVAAAAPTCTVWSFDCLGRDRAPPAGGGDSGAGRIFSRKGCLGASTGPRPGSGLPVLSYADMRREMGMNESLPIALLRLDIEGWEYEALRAVVAAPGAANNAAPAEIALRLHFHVPGNATLGLPWRGSGASPPGAPEAEIVAADRDKETGEIALFIDHLWRSAGYYPVERTDSSAASPGSTELLLVRGPRHSEAYEDWADASAHGHAAHQCALCLLRDGFDARA